MNPFESVQRAPTLGETAAAVEGFRPRTRADFEESNIANVAETTIALRKEELLRMLIAGKRTREAAQLMHLSVSAVRTYIRCPEFQMKLWNQDQKLWARVDEEIRQSKLSTIVRIQEMSEVALERIAALMDSEDESISLRASQDVLDRNPETSKHSRQDTSAVVVNIDPAQLALAAQVAQEMEARRIGTAAASASASIIDGSSEAQSE